MYVDNLEMVHRQISKLDNQMKAMDRSRYSHAKRDFNKALKAVAELTNTLKRKGTTIPEGKLNEMQMVNKKTGKDITKYVIAYMEKKITKKEFEKLTGLKKEKVKVSEQTDKGVIWKDTRKYKIQKPPRNFAQKAKMGAMIHFTGPKSGAKGETWAKVYQDGWMCIFGEGVKGDRLSSKELDKKLESHGRVQIKEQRSGGDRMDSRVEKAFTDFEVEYFDMLELSKRYLVDDKMYKKHVTDVGKSILKLSKYLKSQKYI